MNYQNNGKVEVIDNQVFVDGKQLPPLPKNVKGNSISSIQTEINYKIFIDGYEFKNGKWKKTLKALWHKYF